MFQFPEIDPEKIKIVTCTIEGILEDDDINEILKGGAVAEQPASSGSSRVAAVSLEDPSSLKRLKEKHHSVARLVASGVSQRLVASFSGYTESYLSVLLNNPAMMELVTVYRMEYGKSAEIIAEKLRSVGTQALERLEDRIPDMDDNALIQTAKLGLDRSGHGPSSTSHVVNETHLIDHAEIARLNTEARRGSIEYITPIEHARKSLPAPDDEE